MKLSRATLSRLTLHILAIALAALPLASCKKGDTGGKPADVDYYTCTMHPSVKSQDPKAKCPICSMDLVPVMKKASATTAKPADVDYCTCTMHPSVRSQDPKGKCPICGMDLVPVMKKGAAAQTETHDHARMVMEGTQATETPIEFMVPVERQQQIGVTYAE